MTVRLSLTNYSTSVRSEVLTVASKKMAVFWVVGHDGRRKNLRNVG
jgi:hypothetical protein